MHGRGEGKEVGGRWADRRLVLQNSWRQRSWRGSSNPITLRLHPPAASRCPTSTDSSGRLCMKAIRVLLQVASLAGVRCAVVVASKVPFLSARG